MLDVSVRARASWRCCARLCREDGMAVLMITHDLATGRALRATGSRSCTWAGSSSSGRPARCCPTRSIHTPRRSARSRPAATRQPRPGHAAGRRGGRRVGDPARLPVPPAVPDRGRGLPGHRPAPARCPGLGRGARSRMPQGTLSERSVVERGCTARTRRGALEPGAGEHGHRAGRRRLPAGPGPAAADLRGRADRHQARPGRPRRELRRRARGTHRARRHGRRSSWTTGPSS